MIFCVKLKKCVAPRGCQCALKKKTKKKKKNENATLVFLLIFSRVRR